MKTVTASQFKAKSASLLDAVSKTGEALEVTKRGKPHVCILPPRQAADIFGAMRDEIKVHGDIVASVGERWHCET